MCGLRPLLLTVIFLLVSTRIDIAIATHSYECDLPAQFAVKDTNRGKAEFYQSQLTIRIPDYHGYTIFKYPESKTITFGLNPIVVNFNGNVVYDSSRTKRVVTSVSQTFNDRISGVAQRIEMNSTDSDISDCHIYLLPMGVEMLNVSSEIAKDIRYLAESCVQSVICLNIGKMNKHYEVRPLNMQGLAKLPGLSGPKPYSGSFYGPRPFQNAINTLLDNGLAGLIAGFKATRQSTIEVPKIDSHFTGTSLGYKVKGHFEALNGTFSDLTTLERQSIPTVSHEGMKFTISGKFVIKSPKLNYDYRLKYGSMISKGELTATINAVNLEARLVADYNNIPCTTDLEHIKVTDFVKLTSHLTGINPKSAIIKRQWIDEKTLDGIRQKISQNLRSSAEVRLWYFDCEQFRP